MILLRSSRDFRGPRGSRFFADCEGHIHLKRNASLDLCVGRAMSRLSALINGKVSLPLSTEFVCIGVIVLYSIGLSLITRWL